MTKVLVHGNPETAAIWRPLIAALEQRGVFDVVTVSPPGFGAPLPAGFEATPAGYVEWLAGELTQIGGTIDLVGHDWGTGHVLGLAAAHPELIRSWACDIIGLAHPDYVWHDAAQQWRTPDVGEEAIAGMLALPVADRAAMFEALAMPSDIAAEVSAAVNEDMGACILSLYRAADPEHLIDLGHRLAAAEPRRSLALSAENDAYIAAALNGPVAERMGSELVTLAGQGHWWMLEDPAPAADALADFWSRL